MTEIRGVSGRMAMSSAATISRLLSMAAKVSTLRTL
jgi:hypothetical protein